MEPECPISFSDDVKLSFGSLPAGIHKLAIGYEGDKKLVANRFMSYCPDASNLSDLISMRKTILADRRKFHVGAVYLCRQKSADYMDSTMDAYLGRIGTFHQYIL
jgi:hypothetical protein